MRYADAFCTYREVHEPIHAYIFTGPCVQTGKPYSVTVKGEELYRYRQGVHIQNAMPSLSADDREFLLSGFSPEGWNQAFPPDEDD